MMSLWDALRMNMMISYQELVRTFHNNPFILMPLKLKGRHGIAAMFITWRNLQFYLLILRHTHNQRR